MTAQQFEDRNFHEYFGVICEAWMAKHESGATFSKDIAALQAKAKLLLRSYYEQLTPAPAESPKPPPAPLRNGVPPATQPQAPVPRGK